MLRRLFVQQLRQSGYSEEDIHPRMMQRYPYWRLAYCCSAMVVLAFAILLVSCITLLVVWLLLKDLDPVIGIMFSALLSTLLAAILIPCTQYVIDALVSALYFRLYTSRGEALNRADFAKLARDNPDTYKLITRQSCIGYCYDICFRILKTLQVGTIFITAVPVPEAQRNLCSQFQYTAHMLYENRGWVFDPATYRQYRKDEYASIYGIPWEYDRFTWEDVRNISYDEFRRTKGYEFAKYCAEHDCHERFSYL